MELGTLGSTHAPVGSDNVGTGNADVTHKGVAGDGEVASKMSPSRLNDCSSTD